MGLALVTRTFIQRGFVKWAFLCFLCLIIIEDASLIYALPGIFMVYVTCYVFILFFLIHHVVNMIMRRQISTTNGSSGYILNFPSDASITTITDCDTTTLSMDCSPNEVILYGYIQYGRWDNSECTDSSFTTSRAALSQNYSIPSRCIGLNSCDLGPLTLELANDPYPNVMKQYIANFVCGNFSHAHYIEI